jgi:hypothetical protein
MRTSTTITSCATIRFSPALRHARAEARQRRPARRQIDAATTGRGAQEGVRVGHGQLSQDQVAEAHHPRSRRDGPTVDSASRRYMGSPLRKRARDRVPPGEMDDRSQRRRLVQREGRAPQQRGVSMRGCWPRTRPRLGAKRSASTAPRLEMRSWSPIVSSFEPHTWTAAAPRKQCNASTKRATRP